MTQQQIMLAQIEELIKLREQSNAKLKSRITEQESESYDSRFRKRIRQRFNLADSLVWTLGGQKPHDYVINSDGEFQHLQKKPVTLKYEYEANAGQIDDREKEQQTQFARMSAAEQKNYLQKKYQFAIEVEGKVEDKVETVNSLKLGNEAKENDGFKSFGGLLVRF